MVGLCGALRGVFDAPGESAVLLGNRECAAHFYTSHILKYTHMHCRCLEYVAILSTGNKEEYLRNILPM